LKGFCNGLADAACSTCNEYFTDHLIHSFYIG
jgi:hypothetical protein